MFVQASLAVFAVNALVVTVFSLLGARDLRGILELWFASAVSAGGSGIATVGTFAVLGSVFGILTVFQLLELANPSQPLLRRVLVETPGTYHHSLMVGNLAERAAEAIGADPLVTRVAAYYHDGASPRTRSRSSRTGRRRQHPRSAEPEVSAQILKQHVADGIDQYKARLPRRSSLHPAAPRDGDRELLLRPGEGAGRPGATIDEHKFRHAGEAADTRGGLIARRRRASVRSSSRDEPAIRAMVSGSSRAHDRRPVRRMRPDPARPR